MQSSSAHAESQSLPATLVCAPPLELRTLAELSHHPRREGAAFLRVGLLTANAVAAYLGARDASASGATRNRPLPAHRFGWRCDACRIAVDDLIACFDAPGTNHRTSRRSDYDCARNEHRHVPNGAKCGHHPINDLWLVHARTVREPPGIGLRA
jgi:hypothetical protein